MRVPKKESRKNREKITKSRKNYESIVKAFFSIESICNGCNMSEKNGEYNACYAGSQEYQFLTKRKNHVDCS
jgi:hypothetical protein